MKIRMLENSVRLRLTQTEVKTLLEEGRFAQTVHFGLGPWQQLHYGIQNAAVSKIEVSFEEQKIWVHVPEIMIDEWARTDVVSLEEHISLNKEMQLRILIEKDFKCLSDRVGEDESDMFPHPNEKGLNC